MLTLWAGLTATQVMVTCTPHSTQMREVYKIISKKWTHHPGLEILVHWPLTWTTRPPVSSYISPCSPPHLPYSTSLPAPLPPPPTIEKSLVFNALFKPVWMYVCSALTFCWKLVLQPLHSFLDLCPLTFAPPALLQSKVEEVGKLTEQHRREQERSFRLVSFILWLWLFWL